MPTHYYRTKPKISVKRMLNMKNRFKSFSQNNVKLYCCFIYCYSSTQVHYLPKTCSKSRALFAVKYPGAEGDGDVQ